MKRLYETVSFRKLSSEIPSTNYASHGMYYHPAKFIPQVVSWFIKNYTREGDWIIDPFAGVGTLALECLFSNRNAICLDLNPLIEPLLNAKTYKNTDTHALFDIEKRILAGSRPFCPKWSRISYWYHPNIMQILEAMWGAYYEQPHILILLALFKTSRRFSYADDQVPKIFRSKRKIKKVDEEIIGNDYKILIKKFFTTSLKKLHEDSLQFNKYYKGGDYIVKGGIDLPCYELDMDVNHLITSPPYGRAHEYIRSFKLELAWIGYDDRQITDLINKEIPYRKISPEIARVEIESCTYELYKKRINSKFIRDYECYFKSVIKGLEQILKKVNGYIGIFVGNATYGGIEPPHHEIFTEHFENRGFKYEKTLIDKIKSRKLFKGRKNLSPMGIEKEYLIILKAS